MNLEHKKLINTFKNGIVPESHLDFILTGRDDEIRALKACFENTQQGIGSIKFLTGPYGSGKTFLLNYAKKMALESNFVVCKIEIDSSLKFYNLKQFYYQVMHNLYVYNPQHKKTSFENIFDLWVSKLRSEAYRHKASNEIAYVVAEVSKYNQSFARAFLSYIKSKIKNDARNSELIVSWLTGESNIPFQLKEAFQIKGEVTPDNAMDFLKAFAHLIKLLGYNGLVILIDEMDYIMTERSDLRIKAYHNLRHLIDLTVTNALPNTFMLFSGAEHLFLCPDKGIDTYEALAQRLNYQNPYTSKLPLDLTKPVMSLAKLKFEMYDELSEKLTYIYKKVYALELKITTSSLKNWVFLDFKEEGIPYQEVSIRAFITKYIAFMDLIHQQPEAHMFSVDLYAFFNNKSLDFKSKAPNPLENKSF